jgi:hypothetical protein
MKQEFDALLEKLKTERDEMQLKMQDLFTQALGINSPWFIKDVSFDNIHVQRSSYDDRFWLWCHRLYMLLYQQYYL